MKPFVEPYPVSFEVFVEATNDSGDFNPTAMLASDKFVNLVMQKLVRNDNKNMHGCIINKHDTYGSKKPEDFTYAFEKQQLTNSGEHAYFPRAFSDYQMKLVKEVAHGAGYNAIFIHNGEGFYLEPLEQLNKPVRENTEIKNAETTGKIRYGISREKSSPGSSTWLDWPVESIKRRIFDLNKDIKYPEPMYTLISNEIGTPFFHIEYVTKDS